MSNVFVIHLSVKHMQEQEKAAVNGEGAAQQQHPNTLPPTRAEIPAPKSAPPEQPATAQQLEEVEEKMSAYERSTLRWARAAVIISVLAFLGILFQGIEMFLGSTDTHNLAVAAANQATWTQKLSEHMQTQADRTKDLADRMKDQADETKIIAKQAVIQANAAKSAAETANKALHISERAYIVIALPTLDTTTKYITVPVINTGHIPSGRVVVTVHEATIDHVDIKKKTQRISPTEAHWKHYEFASIPTTGQIMNFNIPVPALDTDRLNAGREQIFLVGIISYNDGFADDPAQQWPFCEGSAMLPQSKNLQWVICDPSAYLLEAIKSDRYPDNEYPN